MLMPCERADVIALICYFKLADVMPIDCGMCFILFKMADVIAMALSFFG